jgi:hypothetical protein
MFVTMDAFRPGTLAPSDLFLSRAGTDRAPQTAATAGLGGDPLAKSLSDFFESTKDR